MQVRWQATKSHIASDIVGRLTTEDAQPHQPGAFCRDIESKKTLDLEFMQLSSHRFSPASALILKAASVYAEAAFSSSKRLLLRGLAWVPLRFQAQCSKPGVDLTESILLPLLRGELTKNHRIFDEATYTGRTETFRKRLPNPSLTFTLMRLASNDAAEARR